MSLLRTIISRALLCLLIQCVARAQDTIMFKDKSFEAARVLEVRQNTIRFLRSDNLIGPVHVRGTNDIEYIRYRNGKRDFFIPTPAISETLPPHYSKIEIVDKKYVCEDEPLSVRGLLALIDNLPPVHGKAELLILKKNEAVKKSTVHSVSYRRSRWREPDLPGRYRFHFAGKQRT